MVHIIYLHALSSSIILLQKVFYFYFPVTEGTYSCFQCPKSQLPTFLSRRWQWPSQTPSVLQSCCIPDTSSLRPYHLVEPVLPMVRKHKDINEFYGLTNSNKLNREEVNVTAKKLVVKKKNLFYYYYYHYLVNRFLNFQ